jgi:hypothetical protein
MLKSVRHSIRKLSQLSRDRWQQPIAAGIENVGEKHASNAVYKPGNMNHIKLHIRKDWAVPLSVPFSMP